MSAVPVLEKAASEGEQETVEQKRKKIRRRRGQKGRFRPYHELSTDEKLRLEQEEQDSAERKRTRSFRSGQAMAPYNTTQFLLEDREARGADATTCDEPPRQRLRSISVGSEVIELPEEQSTSEESEADREMDREFDTVYDEVAINRIEHLSKDEMARQLVTMGHDHEEFVDALVNLKHENTRLKALLSEHGIDWKPAARA